jgi:histidinol-phosphate aminotransferase
MNSATTQGVSRRSFVRILGAASVAATSLPAFGLQQTGSTGSPQGDAWAAAAFA